MDQWKMNAELQKANRLKKSIWTKEEFKAYTGKESDLQGACEELLQYYPDIQAIRIPDLLYFVLFSRLPDGRSRFQIIDRFTRKEIPGHWYQKISSWLKGICDLTLIRRAENFNVCACVEVKTAKGVLTKHQKKFGDTVKLEEVRSLEEFEKILKALSK